jgi:hypothetical protein
MAQKYPSLLSALNTVANAVLLMGLCRSAGMVQGVLMR